MSVRPKRAPVRVALGLRAQRGGAVVVGVTLENSGPRIVLSSFLSTAQEGDRLSLEPYHVAAAMKRSPNGAPTAEARAAVASGRKRQDALAEKGLGAILDALRKGGHEPALAALLVNRAGWMSDLLAYSLAFRDHPPVAEGLAVREALRTALAVHELAVVEMDETSMPELAAQALRIRGPLATPDQRLKELGVAAGRPWRKEQKLACLAAWVALTPQRPASGKKR